MSEENHEMKTCPECNSPYGYALSATKYACPECDHQWNPNQIKKEDIINEEENEVIDVNGKQLSNGDTVIVIKDLPVKGAPKPIKAGTKVKNIKLSKGDHNISCKISGFGAMGLKSEFVKKV